MLEELLKKISGENKDYQVMKVTDLNSEALTESVERLKSAMGELDDFRKIVSKYDSIKREVHINFQKAMDDYEIDHLSFDEIDNGIIRYKN